MPFEVRMFPNHERLVFAEPFLLGPRFCELELASLFVVLTSAESTGGRIVPPFGARLR